MVDSPGRDALIMTKLGVQARGRRHVDRERLRERLDSNPEARLVLVSAPAGFGKSTLLANWLDRPALEGAWLSLDARDNDGIVPGVIPIGALVVVAAVEWLLREKLDGWAFLATGLAIVLITATMFLNLYPRVMPSSISAAWREAVCTTT